MRTLLAAAKRAAHKVIEIQSSPVRGRLGEVGRFAVLTDRTASCRSDRQLLQAHKLEALGILTAGIAHEVNNPLAFVRANLSGLEELGQGLRDPTIRAALPPKLAELASDAPELVAEAIEGVERIGRLVRRLRRFARGEGAATPYEPVDLREVAEKACALSSVGLPAGAIHRVLHPVPLVAGNEDELVQIAVNLLVNAIQASGGRPEIEVEVRSARGGVTLAVRDRGEGIPAAALPRLFDPFFTTKPPGQGTGLGLSLSFDLARQHGGTLEGANRPGGGAEFELWIPALSYGPAWRDSSSSGTVKVSRTRSDAFTYGPFEPLTSRGRDEALAIAALMRARFDPVALYASPFVRALETAQQVGRVLGLLPKVVEELREQDFGALRGQPLCRLWEGPRRAGHRALVAHGLRAERPSKRSPAERARPFTPSPAHTSARRSWS